MVGGDHDRDQRVGEGLVDVGGVLGVLGEPVQGGDDAVADLPGSDVIEETAQARSVHAHPRVTHVKELVGQPEPEPLGGQGDLRPLAIDFKGGVVGVCVGGADVGDRRQVDRQRIGDAHDVLRG